MPRLETKSIVGVASSFAHCVALEREDIAPIHEWDYIQTSKWFFEQGFPEISNIIKFNKISG